MRPISHRRAGAIGQRGTPYQLRIAQSTVTARFRAGNVLVLTIIIAAIIGIVLGTSLMLIQGQSLAVSRSQAWNGGIAVAEAGVEEALAHLNSGAVFILPSANRPQPAFASDGWAVSGNTVTAPRRYLGSNYYEVAIDISNPTNPVIYSTGYVAAPITAQIISRAVRVRTEPVALFDTAMVSIINISLNGNNMVVDSYDSTDPKHNTGGQYDPTKALDHGDLVTDSVSSDKNNPAINVQNASVKGRVRHGPLGLVGINNNGSVGDLNWVNSGRTGIETTPPHETSDVNISLPDVQPPYGANVPPPTSGSGNKDPDYILDGQNGGIYYLSSINLNTTSKTNSLYVTGNSQLYVSGTVSIAGGITILPGASLQLFVGSGNTTLGSVYDNGATNFQYYGLPGNTGLSLGGNNNFSGIIYANHADLTLNGGGGGSTNLDFCGTYYIHSATWKGHFNFHFDQSLPKFQVYRGFLASSWEEL